MAIHPSTSSYSGSQTVTLSHAPVLAMNRLLLLPMGSRGEVEEERTPLSVIMELGKILIKYGKEEDLLSLNLFLAGHTFMSYVVGNSSEPFELLLERGIEKIEEIRKVLQNPHDPTKTLRDPQLLDDVDTWEKSDVDAFIKLAAKFSPERPIRVSPHHFAKEVIDWMDALPLKSREELPEVAVTPLQIHRENRQNLSEETRTYAAYRDYTDRLKGTLGLREEMHQKLAKIYEATEIILRQQEMIAYLEATNVQLFECSQSDLARQEASSREQFAEFDRVLSENSRQQKETRELYSRVNDEVCKQLNIVEEEVTKAKMELNLQQQQIVTLSSRLESCYRELAEVKNKAEGGCTIL